MIRIEYDELIEFIYYRTGISKDIIKTILDTEEEYMRKLGLVDDI